jgi:hypothetical protein
MTLVGYSTGRQRVALAGLVWLGIATGCQLTPSPGLVACPLPSVEQAVKVVQVAPLGTSREEAMQRLKEAGIRGNFGENESIFYCDVWERDKTERWHINVVLLFDEQGRLYATRPDVAASRESNASPGAERVSTHTVDGRDPFE